MAVYFDNAATTAPTVEVLEAFNNALMIYGNPSSMHAAGMAARSALEKARATLAGFAGCKTEELYFTASGTEANNTAIFGVMARAKNARRVVLTDSEHPSVTECVRTLERWCVSLPVAAFWI